MLEKYYREGMDYTDVKQWFEENALEYFDTVEFIADTNASPYNGVILTSHTDNNYPLTLYLYVNNNNRPSLHVNTNAGNIAIFDVSGGPAYINRIIKTDYGIAIGFGNSSASYKTSVLITKDNYGNTCVIYDKTFNSALSEIYSASGYSLEAKPIAGSTANHGVLNEIEYLGMLPCPIRSSLKSSVTPNCLMSVYGGTIVGTETEAEFGGEKYWYNGYIALKE